MTSIWKIIIGLIITLFVFQVKSLVFAEETSSNNELIIKYIDHSQNELSKKEKKELKITSEEKDGQHELVEVQQGDLAKVKRQLELKDGVDYVVENTVYRIADEPINIADPLFGKQWNLERVNAPKIWREMELFRKIKVKVAIIDTGVSNNHIDLKGRVSKGQTFLNKGSYKSNLANDDHGHGTFIAGIIAANTNNQIGVASVSANSNIEILPIKVMNSSGYGESFDIAKGIKYAVDNGVAVINLSISGDANDLIKNAIIDASKKGILIVAAAGNGGENADLFFPGALSQVISVGSTTISNKLDSSSNRGKSVDLVAPGRGITSTSIELDKPYNTNYYKLGNGTSYATPHVAAIAAMYKLKYPDATAKEMRIALEKTATDLGRKGKDAYYGNGLVNAQTTLAFKPIRTIPKITAVSISNKSNKAVIKTEKLARVTIKVAGESYTEKANSNGVATVTIKKPKAGIVWQATAVNLGDNQYKLSGSVADRVAPKITSVTAANNSTKVIVKTEKGARISLKINGKTYVKTANSSGFGIFTVSKPSAGKKWFVSATDASKNKSELTGVVKDRIAPKIVKVLTKVKTSTTMIKGTAEKNTTITVYKNSKKYKTVKATSTGKFTVFISKQKKNTRLSFYAKDQSGNQSKGLKLTVK